jgi:hypothetical protein
VPLAGWTRLPADGDVSLPPVLAFREPPPAEFDPLALVRLYTLNPVDPWPESARFQTLNLKCDTHSLKVPGFKP